MSGRLRDRVAEGVVREGLWSAGDRVAVAVSGGLDSVVLLELLHRTARWHGGRLSVVTVDHGTRSDSAEHAAFVVELAETLGLRCQRHTLALGPDASEATCRAARYALFDALDVDVVALAHHRDDQAETVLLHLLRGAGTGGLAGMAPRFGRYARPLLDVPRDELAAWAETQGLAWREDPSNRDPRFVRNRLRHEVLPLLHDVRPGASATLARTARHLAADEQLLQDLVDADPLATPTAEGWPVAWLLGTPEPLVRRALARHLPELTSAHLDALIGLAQAGRGGLDLPGGRSAQVAAGRLWVGEA